MTVSDGRVACWGLNSLGQLGSPANRGTDRANPTPVFVDGLDRVTSVVAGAGHACALRGGDVYCWGNNRHGQLGVEESVGTNAPVSPTRVPWLSQVGAISAGLNVTCALRNGDVLCFGANEGGQLGTPFNNESMTPNHTGFAVENLATAQQLATGGNSTCTVSSGQVWCFGINTTAALGVPRTQVARYSVAPVRVPGLSAVSRVSVGGAHACALSAGQVWCWGLNQHGQLGTLPGASDDVVEAPRVLPATAGTLSMSTGGGGTCVVGTEGRLSCWGTNVLGAEAVEPTMVGLDFTTVSVGHGSVCALSMAGAAMCWGLNRYGNLGDGTTEDIWQPRVVLAPR